MNEIAKGNSPIYEKLLRIFNGIKLKIKKEYLK